MAPEVYDGAKYNPQMVDIWSLAIIFCCMSLRRFPWKQPRITDASYKLFVSPSELPVLASSSTQGVRADQKATPMKKVEGPTSLAGGFATDGPSVEGQPHHHHHHHHNDGQTHTGDGAIQSAAAPAAKEAVGHISQPSNETQQQQQVIKGPWRLLRLLPRESRYIIGQMLEVDISKRATMDQILADRWILSSEFCYQEDGGQVINAARHQHTLEPGGTTLTPAPSRK